MKRNKIGRFAGKLEFRVLQWYKRVFIPLGIIALAVLGSWYFILTAYAKTQVEEPKVEVKREIPPILRKIAKAESGNSHFCTKALVKKGMCEKGAEGQVLVNKTRDVGRYAINLYYNGKWCSDRGFNIFEEQDNEDCALALFYERGSTPWDASQKNANGWNK